jgi:hypothetical protein
VPTFCDGAVILDVRKSARKIPVLGVVCDKFEVPSPTVALQGDSWWLAGECVFRGKALPLVRGRFFDPEEIEVRGTAAIAISGARMLVIANADSTREPSVWIAVTLSRATLGMSPVEKQKPWIGYQTEGWTVMFRQIAQVTRGVQARSLPDHEQQFLDAVDAADAAAKQLAGSVKMVEVSEPAPPGPTHTWLRDDQLAGLYRLHIDGVSAAGTSLVDRSLSRGDQLEALAKIEWAPPQQLAALFTATEQGLLPAPFSTGFPEGRVAQPFLVNLSALIDLDDPPESHPVRDYLWPVTDDRGQLALEPGEQILATWGSDKPAAGSVKDGKKGTVPLTLCQLEFATGYITTSRVVHIGKLHESVVRASDSLTTLGIWAPNLNLMRTGLRMAKRLHDRKNMWWMAHYRHDWLTGFGVAHTEASGLAGGHHDDHMWLRLRTPDGMVCQLNVPIRQSQANPVALGDLLVAAVAKASPASRVGEGTIATAEVGANPRKKSQQTTISRAVVGGVVYSLPAELAPVRT